MNISHGRINAGSSVTLTCTVELNPVIDVPVTVNAVWSGPDGFMITNAAQRVMGSNTTYTSTAMVRSFGREQSGVYTCAATINPVSPNLFLIVSIQMQVRARVTAGKSMLITTGLCNHPYECSQVSTSL